MPMQPMMQPAQQQQQQVMYNQQGQPVIGPMQPMQPMHHPLPEQKSKIWCTRTTSLVKEMYMTSTSKNIIFAEKNSHFEIAKSALKILVLMIAGRQEAAFGHFGWG